MHESKVKVSGLVMKVVQQTDSTYLINYQSLIKAMIFPNLDEVIT